MILTGSEIKKEVDKGNIYIDPFVEDNLNPNSCNYRLGRELFVLENSGFIDSRKPTDYKKIYIAEEGYILEPGRVYLGHTYEKIGSKKYLTILIGRSSVGRLGLYLQITADLGHIGTKHCWTLELHVVQPLIVYPLMKIGQVSFWKARGGNRLDYESEYQRFSTPLISKLYKELQER